MPRKGERHKSKVNGSISLEAEVPEVLFAGMREFIDRHPHWDQYSVITTALADFLVQNGWQDQAVYRHDLGIAQTTVSTQSVGERNSQ